MDMKLKRLFAMLMAALFILNSAAPLFDISYAAASHDYREWPFAGVNKPTAKFEITNRRTGESVTSPEGYSLSSSFPKINAQVGDVIEFTDMSIKGSGSRISGHDFQWREGSGKFNVQSGMKSSITVNSEGTWSFYLGVKDNASVPSPWSNWSENGNHRWISENIHNTGYDMYWYFTAVSVEVGPKDPPQAEFEIRYDGSDVTDNQSNPISLESLPYQVSLIDKSTSASSSITQWEWKTWQGGAWQQFSTSKNPTFNVDATIKGFMLTVWDANGTKSEWVKHDVYADVDGAPPPEEPDPEPDPGPDPDVDADLYLDVPSRITWNYKEFENNDSQLIDIELDASDSYSALDIDDYDYYFEIDRQEVDSRRSSRSRWSTDALVYPNDVNGNSIEVFGEVEVTDETGYSDFASDTKYITVDVINEPPNAYFTASDHNYATLPVTLTDGSSDPEDDMSYYGWVIRNSDGDVIYFYQHDLVDGSINTDFSEYYFDDVTFSQSGGQLVFNRQGYYEVELQVYDNASRYPITSESDTYKKTIYVNSEPQPPVADFEVYDFAFVNESIPVLDKSTDPNDDIVSWHWTKPSINKETGVAAPVSGSLYGSGGNLTFTEEGAYDIALRVVDYTGLEDSITKEVKVIPPVPVARVTVENALEESIKENRKIVLSMEDSLSPRVDPIHLERNIWEITPLDGQNPDSIKMDADTSTDSIKNVLFKEPGRYEVYLKVHNNFSDANPSHPNIDASETTEIIDVRVDEDPISDFTVGGASPNFFDNPVSTTVSISDLAYSVDADLIDKLTYRVYRDMDEDGDFSDESLYGKYDGGDVDIVVTFQQGVSGMFKVELETIEEFGQPTIDKFVTPEDRRRSVASKTFTVDWRPDIKFDIPDWAYTDDVLNFGTQLKDEKINTLNVDWSIKRASESDTGTMVSDDIDTRTDNILDNNGGSIRFKDSGYYELIAKVTDEVGQSYTFSDTIRIYPLPTAVIEDGMSFRNQEFVTKENRKYQLDGNSSFAHDYYGPELHTIDKTKDYWEIIPLDGQNAEQVIKVANGSGELVSDVISSTMYRKANNSFDEDLLFKLEGRYKVRYQVTNSHGKKSPFIEQEITVVKDTDPIIDLDTVNPVYRNPADSNRATLRLYNIDAASADDDIITNSHQTVRYRFDSDNDGNFAEHPWSGPITINFTNNQAEIKVNHVGRYQFEFSVNEDYGQETLPQFITEADKKASTTYREIEVANIRPTVEFNVMPVQKVDVVFTVGQIDRNKTSKLQGQIDTYIRAPLGGNKNDLIDTNIEQIETSTVSSEEQGASAIFSSWRSVSVPQNFSGSLSSVTGGWKIENNKVVATGGYRPARAWMDNTDKARATKDADIEFTWGITNSANSFSHGEAGFMFRIKDDRNYYVYIMDNHSACGNVRYNNTEVLVKVTNGSRQIISTNSFPSFKAGQSHDFKIETNGNNVKIYRDGSLRFNYTDNNNPHLNGSYGFYVWDQLGAYFSNVKITSESYKTLDEVLKEPNWRDDAVKFIINLSDVKLPELEPSSSKYPIVLSRMLSDGLYFGELGTSTNRTQILNFIAANDGKGKFVYNSPNMDVAMDSLGKWMLSVLESLRVPSTQYLLLDEEIAYKTFYDDYENDPQMATESWRYAHDHNYFENSLGLASFNNIWLSNSVNSFNKVGKFSTEYQTKDNPVGSNNRFDEYRLNSEMMSGPLNIFVHRKPIAQFTPTITWSGTTFSVSYAESSYDLDHQSLKAGYYRLDGNDNLVSANSSTGKHVQAGGIIEKKWEHRVVGATNWTSGKLTSGDATKDYQVRLTVRDIDGPNLLGVWSEPEVVLITKQPQPPIAQFTLSTGLLRYNPVTSTINETLKITDTSYDPNGDPIVQWQWKLYKDDVHIATYTSSNPQTSVNSQAKSKGLGEYKLTLQVRDNTASWGNALSTSEVFTQTFRVIPANNPPTANFNPLPNPIKEALQNISWNASVSDPDGHPVVRKWTLERYPVQNISNIGSYVGSPSVYNYSSSVPFSGTFKNANRPWGAYRITLEVTDTPPVPPYSPGDAQTVYVTKTLYVIPDIKITNAWYESEYDEVIVGDPVTIKATTTKEVTHMKVELDGKTYTMSKSSETSNSIEWKRDIIIPDTIGESGDYTLKYTASTNYGGNGSITHSVSTNRTINIIALKLTDFRITDIVNQDEYPYPIRRSGLALDYKTGYKVTFEINAKGNPSSVVAKVKKNATNDKDVNLISVRTEGNEVVYEGTYYADALTPAGTKIYIDLTAYRGSNSYNYNAKESWNGHILTINGTALQDGRINLTN